MSAITVFAGNNPAAPLLKTDDRTQICAALSDIGVRFEQWSTDATIVPGDSQEKVVTAYQKDIARLMQEERYQTVDVVSLNPDHPDKDALRRKFLDEHTHSEDEVRFFVAGQGLFSLHVNSKVYEVLCIQGDLISVPANTTHWFDMGPNPYFIAIRLFNNPEGWVANFTGNDIATRFSRLEN